MLGRLVGMRTTAKARGRKPIRKETGSRVVKTRDGNKTPYGTVDGGKRNQGHERSENRGRERNITSFPVPVP